MADKQDRQDVVVTFDQIRKAVGVAESAAQSDAEAIEGLSPVEQGAMLASIGQAMRALEEEAQRTDPDVLSSPQNAVASLLQSYVASGENAEAELVPLASGGREVRFDTTDAGWARVLFQWLKPGNHELLRPTDFEPASFPGHARLALLGDWGTGLYGAPVCAQSIEDRHRKNPFSVVVHLGDVYYSGTVDEVNDRFLSLWPRCSGAIQRACNANHEMYSGGFGYFDSILPTFDQEASYFALQNDDWLLIGLDTAYEDHDLDSEQVDWVQTVIGNAGDRKVILFSHHQPFSSLEGQGPQLQRKLRRLLRAKRITAWYWGHEHRCTFYERHAEFGLWGRCVGHSGMPYSRKDVEDFPFEEIEDTNANWRSIPADGDVPASRTLDGPNEYVARKEDLFGPNGYVTLEFQGDKLIERVHTPAGKKLFRHTIQ